MNKSVAVLVWVAAVTAVLIGAALYWLPCLRTAEAAAWVQAVGSVLAIVFAFAVASHSHELQVRAAERSERETKLAALESWFQLTDAAAQKAETWAATAKGQELHPAYLDCAVAEMETMHQCAQRLDLRLLKGYAELEPVVASLALMRAAVAHLVEGSDRVRKGNPYRGLLTEQLKPIAEDLHKQAQKIHAVEAALRRSLTSGG